MKILLTNISESPIPFLMRVESEKIGYIYYLAPGKSTEMTSINTHKDGLITANDCGVFSFSYDDFPRLSIAFIPRK